MTKLHRVCQPDVVERFEATDLGAPFKVVLLDCVRVKTDENGEIESYNIPDPDGLLRTVVLARILHPRKLCGADVKFLRTAVSVKQKDLAKGISVSQEHLSRCESDKLPLSPGSEKLLRLFLFKTAIKHHSFPEGEVKQKLESALDQLFEVLEPIAAYDIEHQLEFCLSRSPHADNDNGGKGWDDPIAVNAR